MAEETEVQEPPAIETSPAPVREKVTPPGARISNKFREEMAKRTGNQVSAPPEEPAPKPSAPPVPPPPEDKIPSPLDIATGDKKPVEKPPEDDKDWEQSDVLKEFDVKESDFRKARKKIWKQDVHIRNLNNEIENLKTHSANGDPNAAKELESARVELQGLKEKVSKQEQDIKAVGAEYSDEYRGLVDKYNKEFDKAVRRFESFSGKNTGDVLADALIMPPGKLRTDSIKAALQNLDTDDRMEVRDQISQVDKSIEVINEFRSDLPSRFDEITKKREESARTQAERADKEMESSYRKVLDELPRDNVFLRRIPEGDPAAEEWNARIKSGDEIALKHLRPGATFQESATLLRKGADYDHVAKYALEMRKRAVEAESRLSEYDQASPDFKGGSRKTPEKPKTPAEKYHEYMEARRAGNEAA